MLKQGSREPGSPSHPLKTAGLTLELWSLANGISVASWPFPENGSRLMRTWNAFLLLGGQ